MIDKEKDADLNDENFNAFEAKITEQDDGVHYEDEDLDKEARVLSPEKAQRKLTELAQESPDFATFKAKLQNNLWWYLGDPMPEPYRSFGWQQFEDFYNQVSGR